MARRIAGQKLLVVVNETLAKSPLFRERLKDKVFGIYRETELRSNPAFFDQPHSEWIELGYTDVQEQICFLRESPKRSFFISMDAAKLALDPFLEDLASLQNISGIGGCAIRADIFNLFPNLTEMFVGERCGKLDLSKFDNLTALTYGNEAAPTGLDRCKKLERLHLAGSPRKRFDLSGVKHLTELKSFSMTYGQFDDLSVLQASAGLRNLHIDPADRIKSIAPLAHLPKLEVLSLNNTRNVEDWDAFPELSELKRLYANNWGQVTLSDHLQPLLNQVELRNYRTNLKFGRP